MIGTLQCAHLGARTWIAHWNESKTWVVPPILSSNALSYVFPQDSQFFMGIGEDRADPAPLEASVWNAPC
jgi:hypothetical protein